MSSDLRKRSQSELVGNDNDNDAHTGSAEAQLSQLACGDGPIPNSDNRLANVVHPPSYPHFAGITPSRRATLQVEGLRSSLDSANRSHNSHELSRQQSFLSTTPGPVAFSHGNEASDDNVGRFQSGKRLRVQQGADFSTQSHSNVSVSGPQLLNILQSASQIGALSPTYGSPQPPTTHAALQAPPSALMNGPTTLSSHALAPPTAGITIAPSSSTAADPVSSQVPQVYLPGSQTVPQVSTALTTHPDIAAARAYFNQMQWHAPVPAIMPNMDELHRDICAAARDNSAYVDKARTTTRLTRGQVTNAEINITCWHIVDVLLKLHSPNIGTKNRKKADPTNVRGNRCERTWTLATRKQLICDALKHSKKLLLDVVDKPYDVEYLLVLAPAFALSKRRRDMDGNDKRGAKTKQMLENNAQQPAQPLSANSQQTTLQNAIVATQASRTHQLGIPIQPNGYTAFASYGQGVPQTHPGQHPPSDYLQPGTQGQKNGSAYNNGALCPVTQPVHSRWNILFGAQAASYASSLGHGPYMNSSSLVVNNNPAGMSTLSQHQGLSLHPTDVQHPAIQSADEPEHDDLSSETDSSEAEQA